MKTATIVLALALSLPFALAQGATTTIGAADTGYMPPIAVIASGDSVVWDALDNTHITQDTPVLGGDLCFSTVNNPGEPSEPVRFDLAGGVLTATSFGETLPCNSAIATPGGAVVLYHCLLHPTMRGALVVTT